MFPKFLRFLILILSISGIANAQIYYRVDSTNGSQLVGGITVTVTALAGAGTYSSYCGSLGPYWIGNGTTTNSAYKFVFSSPALAIRMHMTATNPMEIISSQVNGITYSYTSANISAFQGTCANQNTFIVSGGNLTVSPPSIFNAGATIDINSGLGIDSFLIVHSGQDSGGTVFDFYFTDACPSPILAHASSDTICTGDSLNLFATANNLTSAVTYTWSGPNGFSSGLQNPSIANVSTNVAGIYTVTAIDSGVCNYSSTSSLLVAVGTPFTATASSNSPLCPGDTLLLNTPLLNTANYHWYGPNNFNVNARDTFIHPLLIVDTGNYKLVVKYIGCLDSVITHVRTKLIPPLPVATYNSPLCIGDTLKLSATSTDTAATFSWTGPGSFVSSVENPVIANAPLSAGGTYIVLVSDTAACITSTAVNVLVNPRPANLLISTNSPACYGTTLSLSASSSSSGVVYSWTGPNSLNSTSQNINIPSCNFTDSGTYYLSASINGCSAFDTTHVSVYAAPLAPSASSNSQFCAGDTLFLSATDGTSGVTYSWTGPNGFSSTQQNPIIANTQNADSGNYIVKAVLNGCSSAPDTINAVIYRMPDDTVLVNGKAIICSNTGSLTLAAVVTLGSSYQWYKNGILIPGATSYQYSATSAGSYNVHIFNLQGCSIFTYSVSVATANAPTPLITATGNVLSTGAYASYQWNLNANPIAAAANQSYTAVQNGSYTVTVTDTNGCSATSTIPFLISDLGVAGNYYNSSDVKIFPNPASTVLHVETLQKVNINIQSIDGKVLIEKDNVKNIDVSGLSNGIYMIKITDGQGVLLKMEKLVKD